MVLKVARPKTASVLITSGLVLAMTVLMSMLFAPLAEATSGMISASAYCSDDCVPMISWTSYAWNDGGPLPSSVDDSIRIDLQVDTLGNPWVEIARGEFNPGNGYSFSGTLDASPYAGHGVRLRAYSEQNFVGMSHGADTQKWTPWIYLTDVCIGCDVTTTTASPTTTVQEPTTTTVGGPSTTVQEPTTTTVAGPSTTVQEPTTTTVAGPSPTEPELPYTGDTSHGSAVPLGIAALVLLAAGFGLLVKAETVKSR
jgi:LPXTG-motif cell wall-anchored protein